VLLSALSTLEQAPAQAEIEGREGGLPAEAGRVGTFETVFSEQAPLAAIEVFLDRFGRSESYLAKADPAHGEYDLAKESFQVHVPKSYREGDGWGLFVWVSPTESGKVPTPGTRAALEQHKLIWIGADRVGNDRMTWNRIGLALDAAHNAAAFYDLDPERIYVGGYSGGGRVASALTLHFPEVFKGGLFIYGVDFYRRVPVPGQPGNHWPHWFPVPEKRRLEQIKAGTRLVLLTGEKDFNRLQTAVLAELYRDEGFEQVTYIEIPGAGHYDWPPKKWFSKGLAGLEEAR
jgi:pimeloyl-ACP methyl ester carboxylesterase